MNNLKTKLAELREVCDAATEGPWEWIGQNLESEKEEVLDFICETSFGLTGAIETLRADDADKEFIAQSRTAMPALIEALELAVTEINELRLRYDDIEPWELSEVIRQIAHKLGVEDDK